MSSLNITELSDFTGGLNYRADQFQLASFESPDMLNVEIDPRGGIFSRGGMRAINPTAVAGTWKPEKLWPFNGATSTLMLANDNKVLKSTGGDFSLLEVSAGVPVTSTGTHGACMAQWGDALYVATGAGGSGGYFWKTTDTYATALSASGSSPNAWQSSPDATKRKFPTCEHLLVHANKMFAANTKEAGVAHPNRLRWSLENSPENWDQNDYIDISGGGVGIRGMAVVGGQMLVFKPYAIYVLFGYTNSNFQVVELTSRLGVFEHNAIAQTEEGCYFFDHRSGLYYYNGSSVRDMFENLRPIFDLGYMNQSAHEAISCSWVGKRLWVSVPYSTVSPVTDPTVNFVMDPSVRGGAFTRFATADGFGLIGGTDWTDSQGNDLRVFAHPTEPYVLRVDVYSQESDNITGTDVPFESFYRTRWFDGGSYMQRKMFRRPDVVVKETSLPQAITVKVYRDYKEGYGNETKIFDITQNPPQTGLLWGVGVWGDDWSVGSASATIVTGRNLGLAKAVQLEFSGPPSQAWGVNSIGLKYQARRIKG